MDSMGVELKKSAVLKQAAMFVAEACFLANLRQIKPTEMWLQGEGTLFG